jgi:hypothetical protein
MLFVTRIFILTVFTIYLTACGPKVSVEGGDENNQKPENRTLVFALVKEVCMEESDPPMNTDAICSCVANKTIELQVEKCGGSSTHVNLPCDISDVEHRPAIESCLSL